VRLFHALSDETRLAVVEMLRGGERCVCDLQDALDAAQSRLSFHLKVLKDAGLVTDRKDGRWSYYALNTERLADGTEILGELAAPSASRASVKLHALERVSTTTTSLASDKAAGGSRKRPSVETGDGCC
jgi:ArsR family transcriptional regulator